MKNLALGVIFSFVVVTGSIASVSSGLNLPGEKKKKCKAEKKECKDGKKSCCTSDGEKKDCHKKTEGQ